MDIEERIKELGKKHGYTRLEAIVCMDLGERSEAAKKVLAKRKRRMELMQFTDYSTACLILNTEYYELCPYIKE